MAKAAAKTNSKKAPSKSEVYAALADATQLTKKQIAAVLEALNGEIAKSIGKKGAGVFQIPGLCKITVVHKPATKERKGIDPFTKMERVFKAKPARNVVKVRPLKSLKDMAA